MSFVIFVIFVTVKRVNLALRPRIGLYSSRMHLLITQTPWTYKIQSSCGGPRPSAPPPPPPPAPSGYAYVSMLVNGEMFVR